MWTVEESLSCTQHDVRSSLAVKTSLGVCCLSSIRHIMDNVTINVYARTHTHTHIETGFVWGDTWQDSSVGSPTEGGERREERGGGERKEERGERREEGGGAGWR